MSFLNRFSFFLVPLLFFIISLSTLYDYGINWDSPTHFARGQAYLRYMLTGKTNYDGLPPYCMNAEHLISRVDFETGEVCDRHRKVRVSQYESSLLDFDRWASKNVYGHPAFSDVMLAISNNILYKTLGWVEDIDAYHLYSIFTTFILALTVSLWTKQTFGTFASIIAVLTVYTYPLLFAEQHFNIKDPPMAAFFTLSLYLFYLALVRKRPLFLILSALVGGASFGTKFNFLFAPFILLPWIITTVQSVLNKKMLLAFLIYPIIIFLVFFLTWPAMWSDPIKNIPQVFNYYQDIGGSSCNYPRFTYPWFTECTQLITLKYFIYTSAPFTLLLLAVGLIASVIWFRKNDFLSILLLSFFLVTLLRVTLPISSIYGGLRQIMEFIGPMAMMTGIGALFLRDLIVKKMRGLNFLKKINRDRIMLCVSLIFILGYTPIAVELIKLHPNENVYFNSFIGGLRGAAEKDFPGYGNTYGNAYLQGIRWLNQYSEPNSRLALVLGNAQNIPRGIIRDDISFANGYRSGYNQAGEYQMVLTTSQNQSTETFRSTYLDIFLEPVYDLKVEGISILKIWKNSKDYLKGGLKLDEAIELIKISGDQEITVTLQEKKYLKALAMTFPNTDCKDRMIGATIHISTDGKNYSGKIDEINGFTEEEMRNYKGDLVYLFPGDEVRYIKIAPPSNFPCNLSEIKFYVFTFKKIVKVSNL